MRRLGIGYRGALKDWLQTHPTSISCLEITAEHFFGSGKSHLKKLGREYETYVHGLGLSLGTPGPLCSNTLKSFASVADAANAKWVSEHVAFSRTADVDLGHLNPVPRTQANLDCLIDHSIEVAEFCSRPLILENITSTLDVGGQFSETEFLNRLCESANCGLLLDVTNLFINSKNHGYDPTAWLREIDSRFIKQLHVVGYSRNGNEYCDHHSAAIQPDLMNLIETVIEYADVQAVILERDERLSETEEILSELKRLETVVVN